jgi:pyruvate/2-oxoglutarate dehydrogenase complex dihydrolipoamide acyltransferase (E2) component
MTTPEVPNHQPASTPASPETAVPAPEPAAVDTLAPAAKQRKPLSKIAIVGIASFVLGAIVGITGTAITTSAVNDANAKAAVAAAAKAEAEKPRPLKAAFTSCKLSSSAGADLGDGETSLSLDGRGEEDYSGAPMSDINCALDAINVPDFVRAQMDKTRALDGVQTETWDNITAKWSYHPNSGFNVSLSEKK